MRVNSTNDQIIVKGTMQHFSDTERFQLFKKCDEVSILFSKVKENNKRK